MPHRLLPLVLLCLLTGCTAGRAAVQEPASEPAAAAPEPAAAESAEPVVAAEPIPKDHVGAVKLFILAGQSNMSGRGALPDADETHPRVFVFGNDYRWDRAAEPVDSPDGQVDSVSRDATAGYGPSLAFGRAMAEAYPGAVIGLIPCAKGATIIEEWQRDVSDDALYGSCLKRALAASPMGSLEGMLFFQGESDTHRGAEYHGVPRRPHRWAEKFTAFAEAFRADVGKRGLPIVFAQIGVHTAPDRYINWEVVQAQQASVDLPRTAMITTDDLTLRDRVHYDTPSYRTIGERFAAAMQTLLPPALDLQGHRGARGLLPENTLPSFEKALELGVTTIELDVVVSRDGRVVVSHEPWFNPVICLSPNGEPIAEDAAGNLYRMPYAEVARYDCGRLGHPDFPEQQPIAARKPLLEEVIAMAEAYAVRTGRAPVRYNVEIKSRPEWDGVFQPSPAGFARLVYEVIQNQEVRGQTTIQSFDPRVLDAVHTLDPALSTAFLVGDEGGLDSHLARLSYTPPIYSPYYEFVDAALVQAVHARGMRIIPWTVNNAEAMRALLALGVDGLITDYPDRAAQVLAE